MVFPAGNNGEVSYILKACRERPVVWGEYQGEKGCPRLFEKVDLRAGRIVRVGDFSEARKPAYKLWIDFGPLGTKQSSAQIAKCYHREELAGRLVMAMVNPPPLQVTDFVSEVLVLGVVRDDDEVVLVQSERDVPPGKRVL
ncbi:MAG: tRNA-binding protein [Dehalococcoidia bacterium]|nr:tRNA-binding protein [Dehalococcoidia bacterium]